VTEPFEAHSDRRRVAGPALRLGEAPAGAPERAELEAFVQSAFARKHDAAVTSFMPTLLSLPVKGVCSAAVNELKKLCRFSWQLSKTLWEWISLFMQLDVSFRYENHAK